MTFVKRLKSKERKIKVTPTAEKWTVEDEKRVLHKNIDSPELVKMIDGLYRSGYRVVEDN